MTAHRRSWSSLVGILVGCAATACGNHGSQTGSEPPANDTAEGGGGSSSGGGALVASSSGSPASGGSGSGATGGSSGGDTGSSSGAASSSGGPVEDGGAGPPQTPHMGNTCLKPGSGDYSKAGPYQVSMKTGVDLGSYSSELPPGDAGPTTYTIFYPQPFETNCLHPVVAWGNGTTVTGYQVYQFYNQNAASWGMVVIASDNSNVGSGVYHKAAIDYMAKQNTDSSSIFYQKLSTRVGTSGHSQGGIGATVGAGLIGSNCEAEVCIAGGGAVQKTNAFICLTGSADIAEASCTATYQAAPGQAFLADWDGGDHFTTETVAGYIAGQPGTIQLMRLYAAWFRCFLADDQVACKLFEGGAPSNCGICKDPGWHVLASKGL
jgi:hypothetical protein